MLLLFSNTRKASPVSTGEPVIVASETFTGTNGSAWPAAWTPTHVVGTGSETIQNNAGVMVTGNGSYATEREYFSGMPTLTDTDVTVTLSRDVVGEMFLSVTVDGDNTPWNLDSSYVNNGFIAYLSFDGPTLLGTLTLVRIIAGSQVQIGTSALAGMTPGSLYKWRLQRKGTTVRTKFWDASIVEPSSWGISGTSPSAPPPGKVSLMGQTGASGVKTITWDDVAVSDGTFLPRLGQVAATVTSNQRSIKPVKVWDGSAWVQKTLKYWTGTAWKPTYDATPLIYREYEDSGDPGTYLGNVLVENAPNSGIYNIAEQSSMIEDPNDAGTYRILTYS